MRWPIPELDFLQRIGGVKSANENEMQHGGKGSAAPTPAASSMHG